MDWRAKSNSIRSLGICLCAIPAFFAFADTNVDIPQDWQPDIHAEYIDQIVKPVFTGKEGVMSDYDMLKYGSMMMSIWDAKLLISYISLFQRLSPGEAKILKEDQVKWLAQREKDAHEAGKNERDGTLGKYQYSQRFVEMTIVRIENLDKRFTSLLETK